MGACQICESIVKNRIPGISISITKFEKTWYVEFYDEINKKIYGDTRIYTTNSHMEAILAAKTYIRLMEVMMDRKMLMEACNRMAKIGMDRDMFITPFREEDTVFMFERGISLDTNYAAQKAIKRVKAGGNLPYAVIFSKTEFGDLYAVLFVSKDEDEWAYERPDENGYVYAYVYNATDDICSEYGSIGVKALYGGLDRTE